jgi:adenosylhomocysteine nucleosidase
VATSSRIAVLGAMPSELRPLAKPLELRKAQLGAIEVRNGRLGRTEIVALKTGIGPDEAQKATEHLMLGGPFDRVVMIGIAGGIGGDQHIGDLVVADRVIDGRTGTTYRPAPLPGFEQKGALHTADHLILDPVLLDEMRADGVVALDMETAAVGQVCDAHDVLWSSIRSISDRPTDRLVDDDLLDLTKPDGSPNMAGVVKRLARHPGDIKKLAQLGKDATKAAEAAAEAFLSIYR